MLEIFLKYKYCLFEYKKFSRFDESLLIIIN